MNANEREVEKYFPLCPFCLEGSIHALTETWTTGYDVAECAVCGAKWHTWISALTDKMTWAELTKAGTKGGYELVGTKHEPHFWLNLMASNKKRDATAIENIKEKEVIIKIRCLYCRKIYDETLDKCPHCGASR